MNDPTYFPVWVDRDRTEWIEESLWEQCEFGCVPFDPTTFSAQAGEHDLGEPLETCSNPVEFVGRRGENHIQLCGHHFAPIKARCRVRWDEFIG